MRFLLLALFLSFSGSALADRTDDDLKAFYDLHSSMFDALSMRYTPDNSDLPSTSKPVAGRRKKAAPDEKEAVPQAPTTYTFNGQSSWATMKATVINYHNHFVGKIETDAPAEKWILKDDKTRTEVDSGSLNDAYNFTFDHPGDFMPGYSLTLMIYKDGLQYPSLLSLH